MKRDMDLIRLLLEYHESGLSEDRLKSYGNKTKDYHCALLIEAGYFHGRIIETDDGETIGLVHRLSWTGHEFLDAIRDDTVWNKAKDIVKTSATSATAEILKETCQRILTAGIEATIRATIR